MSIYFDNYNSDTRGKADEIRTPKYNFSTLSTAQLTFDVAYSRYDAQYSDSLKVLVSTDCGATWSQVYFKGGTGLATAADNATAVFVLGNFNNWNNQAHPLKVRLDHSGTVSYTHLTLPTNREV